MKKITQNLRWLVTLLAMIVCMGAWGQETGTITFGNNGTKINSDSVTGNDNKGNTWTITTAGTTSYTQSTNYSQVGSSSKPATSITFTTTLANDVTITSFSAKFGGNNGTAGTVTLKVGDTTVGTGSLNAANDVTVSSTTSATGKVITVTVTGISKGVKCYNITYTYGSGSQQIVSAPTFSLDGGTYTKAQSVTLSCATEGATIYYTTDGNDPTTNSPQYTEPISITETTTLKAIASKGTETSSVATATYTILSPLTIAEARAQETGDVITSGIVTSFSTANSGNTAYIQDATAGICVYGNVNLTVGDEISVQGALTTYRGLLEITNPTCNVISSGKTVTPTVKTIAEINSDNTLQGILVKIENATVTAINGQSTTIEQDGNSIVVRGISGVDYAVDDVITLTGNVGCFDNAQIANPTDVTVTKDLTPKIVVSKTSIELTAAEKEGTINVEYSNVDEADIQFVAADGTTSATYDWIMAEINAEGNIDYIVEKNTGAEARTAYFKVYGLDNAANYVYSELITISQDAPVADYATLPFEFDGGSSAIAATQGLTQDGLGGDYGSSPKLKFDGTGDYVVLHFNERPGTLSFDIKGNSFSGGTFTVQTSEDGETYTDLETYSDLGSTQSEEFKNLGENVRYIKWIYTEKVSGNVALGNIKLKKYVAPEPYTLTVTPNDNAEIFVFYNDPDNNWPDIQSGDEVLAGSEVMVSVSAVDGYVVESVSVTDGEGQKVELTEEEEGISWTFTMPSNNVTVSCTVKEFVPAEESTFVKVTSTKDITDGEYLIVYEGANVAFDGSLESLDAVGNTIDVNIEDNTITCTDAATFTIDVTNGTLKSASGYYIGVTTNENGLKQKEETDTYTHNFSIDNNGNAVIAAVFEGSTMTLRYNSANNQTRFRYYKSGQQAIQLYKKVVEEPETVTVPGTLAAGKFATRIYPFAPKPIEGIVFYSCEGMQEGKATTLALKEVETPEANTPYILENTTEADIDITQTGVDTHEGDTYTAGLLTGVLKAEPEKILGDEYYVLQTQNGKQAFYVANNYSIDVPQYRAYLTVPTDVAGNVKALSLGGDDATAINALDALTSGAYEGIYTVDGVKLNRVEKGVNILKMADGTTRKVIVK